MGGIGGKVLLGCLALGGSVAMGMDGGTTLNPGTLKGTVGLSHQPHTSAQVTLSGNAQGYTASLAFPGNTFDLLTEGEQEYRTLELMHLWDEGYLTLRKSEVLFVPMHGILEIDLKRPTGKFVNTLTVTGGTLRVVEYTADAEDTEKYETYWSRVQDNTDPGSAVDLPMIANTEITLSGKATIALTDGTGAELCTIQLPLESQTLDLAEGDAKVVAHTLTVPEDSCSASLVGKVSFSGLPAGVGFSTADIRLDGQGQVIFKRISSADPNFKYEHMLPGYYALSATAFFERPTGTYNPAGSIYLPNKDLAPVLLKTGETTRSDFTFGAAVVDGCFRPKIFLGDSLKPDTTWTSMGFIFQGQSGLAGAEARFQYVDVPAAAGDVPCLGEGTTGKGTQYFRAVLPQGRWSPPTAYYERTDTIPRPTPQNYYFYYTPDDAGLVDAQSGRQHYLGEFSFQNAPSTPVFFAVNVATGATKPLISNPSIYVTRLTDNGLGNIGSTINRTWDVRIPGTSRTAAPAINFNGPAGTYQLQAYAYVGDVWTRFPGTTLAVGKPALTPEGSAVVVTGLDGEGEPLPVELRFDTVLESGVTSVSLTDMGPMPPPDRDLLELLDGSTYLTVSTTATLSGEIEFALSYDPSALGLTPEEERLLTLQQFICEEEAETACRWEVIGTAGTPASLVGTSAARVIRGRSASLGPVALMLPKVPAQVACVGAAGSPVRLVSPAGACGVTVDGTNRLAGNCVAGSKGLHACTFGGTASRLLGPGLHEVSVLATATDGQQAICSSYLLVEDQQAPQITCPASAPVLECKEDATEVSHLPTTTDNCAGVSVSCTAGSGDTRRPGTSLATCTARDASGNQASCSFNVTLEDTVAPSITCPGPVAAECTGDGGAVVTPPPATAADACFVASVTGPAQTRFPVGVTAVSYKATDLGGLSSTCSSSITVKDTQAPALTLQGGNTMVLACGARYAEPGYSATDGCWGDFTSEVSVSGVVDSSRPGRYTLSYSVADPSGNRSKALRVIDVLSSLLDEGPSRATWSTSGRMGLERTLHTLTPLKDGRVLLSGGFNIAAQLYEPTTGVWSSTGSLNISRRYHTATALSDGRVLIAGGADGELSAKAELYAPTTGTWSFTGEMRVPRRHHTATVLSNGRILVAGGGGSGQGATAELYNPATGTWSATGSMRVSRRHHTATLLSDGRVLVAGGQDEGGGMLATAELYDPATGTWSSTGGMQVARRYHTATPLSDGRVLVAGNDETAQGATAELYNPATGTWNTTGSMRVPRHYHTATLLSDGRVLVVGGYDAQTGIQRMAEVYDACSGTWLSTPSMTVARYHHAATPLPGGRVLIAGGASSGDQGSTELYTPAP
ncbi:kelch repeat-containing protein [Archangium violaceum]|uniref:kelch repeat-containing protein n=1 Tax=Archangium violaceum TaxID=83451 RepID=UPI0036DA9BFC